MTSGVEIELKLSADPEALARLLADPAVFGEAAGVKEQVSTYFDTRALALHHAGLSLRVRRIGDRRVQTVKAESATAASLFARAEWERDIAGEVPELEAGTIPLVPSPGTWPEPVEAVFVTEIRRAAIVRDEAGSQIELVADTGRVVSGAREEAISEIELELKGGDRRALFTLARRLAAQAPLRLGVRSKSERGYALRAGAGGKAYKSEPIRLSPEMDAAALFEAVASACIRHFRLNEDRLLATGGVEPLHQARVALRRLRSALGIFGAMVAGPDHDRLRVELRWIAAQLGEVRDIDVLIPRIDDTAASTLLRQARENALATLTDALNSERMRRLIIDLVEWIAVGAWHDDPERAQLRAMPARIYAGERLDRLRRQVKKRGRDLATLGEEERHEVRIAGKKLRYAAEFFAALFPGRKAGKRRTRFLEALEGLQTNLGDLNDLTSGRDLLTRLGIADPAALLPGGKGAKRMLARAGRAHDALVDEKRFWR